MRRLEQGRGALTENRAEYDASLERLGASLKENAGEIGALVSSLSKAVGTSSEDYILEQIDVLHGKGEELRSRIAELESLTASHALSDIEFDLLRQMPSSFRDTLDDMDVEQKRTALRTFVKRIVWDGETVHLYLFGVNDSDAIDLAGGPEPDDNGDFSGSTDLGEGGNLEPLGEDSKKSHNGCMGGHACIR